MNPMPKSKTTGRARTPLEKAQSQQSQQGEQDQPTGIREVFTSLGEIARDIPINGMSSAIETSLTKVKNAVSEHPFASIMMAFQIGAGLTLLKRDQVARAMGSMVGGFSGDLTVPHSTQSHNSSQEARNKEAHRPETEASDDFNRKSPATESKGKQNES